MEGVELAAVVDANADRAAQVAAEFGQKRCPMLKRFWLKKLMQSAFRCPQ